MLKCRKILILIGCGVIIAGAALWCRTHPFESEPSYKGRTLSEWLYQADIDQPDGEAIAEAENAVRKIGTNAIPHLLKWIRFEPSTTPSALERLVACLPKPVENAIDQTSRRMAYSGFAVKGFSILGPQAAAAIPELTRLMNDTNFGFASDQSAQALPFLGKDALPPLLQALTNPRLITRRTAVSAIKSMVSLDTNTSAAVPILIQAMQDKDGIVASCAATCLGKLALEPQNTVPALTNYLLLASSDKCAAMLALRQFGGKAAPAIPLLLPFLTNGDIMYRVIATNALIKIAPDLLTNPPH